ncbi:ankyrin repeat and SOCS box protein 2 [Bombina bombina]|uniref:ankyrin repeat and SOCS box protein 2 n=1 Tax=Bombina bombina TaxID=8345 RepID=UPI00235B0DE9|nr:ankyrin repeat and SOCS box protein 2 [Bombina bombina]
MATQVSSSRPQRSTIGSEEYTLYSSMSEEELIQMAIEQSLMDNYPSQANAHSHQKLAANVNTEAASAGRVSRPSFPKQQQTQAGNRSSQATATQPPTSQANCVLSKRYDGSYYATSQNVDRSPVALAIINTDEESITNLIKAGNNLSEPDKDGWLPLHEAAYYGGLTCLKILLKAYPASIDQRTLQEETALYMATVRGNLECLQFLLQSGAEPDIANKARETPLYKASERKNAAAAKLLVDYRADVNHRCNRGWTALHESVSRNDLDIIDILVKGGAKIEAKNCYDITPLFVASQSGQLDALRYLVKCGADINTQASDSATALYEACKNGHSDIVEFLLEQGADANKSNKDGLLPIHVAAKTRDNDE